MTQVCAQDRPQGPHGLPCCCEDPGPGKAAQVGSPELSEGPSMGEETVC